MSIQQPPPTDLVAQRESTVTSTGLRRQPAESQRIESELRQRLAERFRGCELAIDCQSQAVYRRAFAAAGVTAGQDVLLAPLVPPGTLEAIASFEARPVWVAVDRSTLTLCPYSLSQRLTENTAAVICSHVNGRSADVPGLRSRLAGHRAALIEDLPLTPWAHIDRRPADEWADVSIVRLTGNAQTCRLMVLAARPSHPISTVMDPSDKPVIPAPHVLTALAALERSAADARRMQALANLYERELAGVPGLRFLGVNGESGEVPSAIDVLVDRPQRLRLALQRVGFEVSEEFEMPDPGRTDVHDPMMAECLRVLEHRVELPSDPDLSDDQVLRICSAIQGELDAAAVCSCV